MKFSHHIFSVKTQDIHKYITICGIKIKIKNKKLIEQQKQIELQEKINKLNNEVKKQLKKEINSLKNQLAESKNMAEYKLCKYMAEEKYPEYLKDWFYKKTGEKLNLENPQTFNEKIQWMKLYDKNPIKTQLADKYVVREWVKERIGEEYLIPLLGVWENVDDIDFDKLPNKFVLKANHGSGWNIIVSDKTALNIQETKQKLQKWLQTNFAYVAGLELHYRNIKPLIIAEKYLETEDKDLKDYKFLCFDGEVKYIWVDKDRYTNHKRNLFDTNWNLLNEKIGEGHIYENWLPCPKPKNLEKMLQFAKILSQNFAFVRVDFYEHEDKLYFGEMTFTSATGLHVFSPSSFNLQLGKMINLELCAK